MKSPEKIKKMFDGIAVKYDFMNNVISFGLHKFIKKSAISKLKLPNNSQVIDLCCGTGDISKLLADKKEVETVIGVDFSDNMLNIAKKNNPHSKIKYIMADCTKLPFEDNSFDSAVMFFGLRNIEDVNSSMKEIYRCLKNNAQFMYMDFSKENKFLNKFFDFFTPFFAKLFFSKNKASYEYLIESKNSFYYEEELVKRFEAHNIILKSNYKFLFSSISAQIYEIKK